MLPDPKVRCPYTGFSKSCHSIVTKHTCPKWVSLKGKNPQTGEVVDRYGCADGFLPLLLVENANMTRQAGAAIEDFRNLVVSGVQAIGQTRQQVLK